MSPISCTLDDNNEVVSGLCSEETEHALIQTNCINSVGFGSISYTLHRTMEFMIQSLCRQDVNQYFKRHRYTVPPCAEDCVAVLTSSGALIYEDANQCLSDCPISDTNTISSPNYPENYPKKSHIYYRQQTPYKYKYRINATPMCLPTKVVNTRGDTHHKNTNTNTT